MGKNAAAYKNQGARRKLSPAQEAQLRADRAAGMSITALAAKYGVSDNTVLCAIRREHEGTLAAFAIRGGQ